jgi:CHAD domain-containing protein
MPTSEIFDQSLTINDFSWQVITQFTHKVFREELVISKNSDPEILHKMRVKMRRLRTVLQILEPLLILPSNFTPSSIGKLAGTLGAVRDVDVMEELLQEIGGKDLPDRSACTKGDQEQQALAKISSSLTHRRQKASNKMEKNLARNYQILATAVQEWLDHPQYHSQPTQLLIDVLPDLLTPIIGNFFLHAGWLITSEELINSPATLHDLRKCTKRMRYQTECFFPYFNADQTQFLPLLESTQEYLGQIQDIFVLKNFIARTTNKKLPVVSDRLDQKMQQAWQNWQPIKLQLCDRQWRQSVRRAVAEI